MKLRNNKIIFNKDDIILNKCLEKLPKELLNIIANFHDCKNCFLNKYIHCKICNTCNQNYKKHKICNICNKCYPITKSILFQGLFYDFVINEHIHCEKCNSVKKYSMTRYFYYCKKCFN